MMWTLIWVNIMSGTCLSSCNCLFRMPSEIRTFPWYVLTVRRQEMFIKVISSTTFFFFALTYKVNEATVRKNWEGCFCSWRGNLWLSDYNPIGSLPLFVRAGCVKPIHSAWWRAGYWCRCTAAIEVIDKHSTALLRLHYGIIRLRY